MTRNRPDDDNLGTLSEVDRIDSRIKRRELIRGLYEKGYSNLWGFGRLVAELCKEQDIPQNAEAIQGDIVAVERLLVDDIGTKFGRARTLDVLKGELMALAQMSTTQKVGGVKVPDDTKRVRVMKMKLQILKQIRELEGQDAPSMVKHTHLHDVNIHHMIQRLPDAVVDELGKADSVEDLLGILTPHTGREDAIKLIASFSSADEDE